MLSLAPVVQQLSHLVALTRARHAQPCREKIRGLAEAKQAAEERNGVLEAHLAQLIAQAQPGGRSNAQPGELQMLAATLDAERSHGSAQAEKLKDAQNQLDRMGSELMNVRAAAREQVG